MLIEYFSLGSWHVTGVKSLPQVYTVALLHASALFVYDQGNISINLSLVCNSMTETLFEEAFVSFSMSLSIELDYIPSIISSAELLLLQEAF